MSFKLNVVCIFVNILITIAEDEVVVDTVFGRVRGALDSTRGGRPLSAFTGIPFAAPPINELRFREPVAATPWSDTLDARAPSPLCVQRNPYIRQVDIEGQEDCLYLNIYTPRTNFQDSFGEALLPVMVFFHGGGLMCGGASGKYQYNPQYLLDRDVVLVIPHYRLGSLGFLSMQDELCPGNNGFKDQQEALRFVQKTIHSFGGDNQSVTIFGESAGGSSVHYHMLSDTSAGLFHRGISQSGTALAPWVEAPAGEPQRRARRLAELLRCPPTPTEAMLDCLRERDSYDIIGTEFQFYVWDLEPMTIFKPVEEPSSASAFLQRNPRAPLAATVPWLTGLNAHEGCLKSGWLTENSTRFREFIDGFESIGPVTLYYEGSSHTDDITRMVKEKYLNITEKEDLKKIKSGIIDMYTDNYFGYPLVEAIELTFQYSEAPIYLYEMLYKASNSFSKIFGYKEDPNYVCHADDLVHLFPIPFLEEPPTAEDIEMSNAIVTMWSNFATSGDPNTPVPLPWKWRAGESAQGMEYLEVSRTPRMRSGLAARSRFWGTLPSWQNAKKQRFFDEL